MTPIVRDGLRHHAALYPYWQCLSCGAQHFLADRIAHAPGCSYNRPP